MDSILNIIFQNAALHPGALCLADRHGTLCYGEYRARICGVAAELQRRGLPTGARVLLRCFCAAAHPSSLAAASRIPTPTSWLLPA